MRCTIRLIGNALLVCVVGFLTACDGVPNAADNADADRSVNSISTISHPAKALWLERCASCHGFDGRGDDNMEAPAINGLPAWYIAGQLRHFRHGIRGGHERDPQGQAMMAAVANISEPDITALTEFMALLPDERPGITMKGDLARGEDYHNNLCSACHGSDGGGNEALQAPPLNTLNDWYIVAQYEKFRAGIRGAHVDDRYGAQMVRFAPAVDAKIIPDIAHFITQPSGQ